MSIEITCRMRRDELLGLLDSMTPIENQRITAEIAVATPPADFAIQFKKPSWLERPAVVIAASFVVTFTVGILFALV